MKHLNRQIALLAFASLLVTGQSMAKEKESVSSSNHSSIGQPSYPAKADNKQKGNEHSGRPGHIILADNRHEERNDRHDRHDHHDHHDHHDRHDHHDHHHHSPS